MNDQIIICAGTKKSGIVKYHKVFPVKQLSIVQPSLNRVPKKCIWILENHVLFHDTTEIQWQIIQDLTLKIWFTLCIL